MKLIKLLVLFTLSTSYAKADIKQFTEGDNSPAISNVSGNVSINYNTTATKKNKESNIQLLSRLDLSGLKKVSTLTKNDITDYLNATFTFKEYEKENRAVVVKMTPENGDDDSAELVVTCRRYNNLIGQGYYASSNKDIHLASRLNRSCETLKYLFLAEKASTSYIQEIKWDRQFLKLLPMKLTALGSMTGEMADENLKTVYELRDRVIVIKREGYNKVNNVNICFEVDKSEGICLETMAKADVNQDGVEDLVVSISTYAVEGSHGYTSVIILTRYDNKTPYKLIKP